MGLLNVSHSQMTQSVIQLQNDLMNNPYYLFNDKKGIPVDYYNINNERTTLDSSLKLSYGESESSDSIRYNLIENFYLYGLDRVMLSLEMGDYGMQSSEVSGEAIILPNTITPYPGDNFVITMVKNRYQFSVNDVSFDTFDNGSNYWKIQYNLSHTTDDSLKNQVINEYKFISGNIGTQYSPIIKKSKYDVASKLDTIAVQLKQLFKGLFFNNKVQTYTFMAMYQVSKDGMNSSFFYDPYMIEFCIRNKILENSGDKYTFIDHKTNLSPMFPINYNRSIWKVLESREKEELPSCTHTSIGRYIEDKSTIFQTRYEHYFELTYESNNVFAEQYLSPIDIIDPQMIGHIIEGQLFPMDSEYAKYNVLIKYFNNYKTLEVNDIIPLERIIDTGVQEQNYFLLPMIIFVIEYYEKNLILRSPNN